MRGRLFLLTLLIGALSGCTDLEFTDVSNESSSRALIGTQYEVVGDVDAYGIKGRPNGEVEYISLIPPPGFTGWERGFKVPLERGSIITVTKVMKTNRWLDGRDAFIVTVEGTKMPLDTAETRLELNLGNEGDGHLKVNPTIYQRIER